MKLKTFLCVLTASLLMSTMEVCLKFSNVNLDVFQMTFARFMMGGLVLLPFAFAQMKRNNISLTGSDMLYLLGLGFLCICVSMIFFQLGVMGARASTTAIIFCTNPVFTMIFASLLVSERFTKFKLLAIFLSAIGLVFIVNPFGDMSGNTYLGMFYTFFSAAVFGLYSALGKRRIGKLGGMTQTALSFIFGSLMLLVIMLIAGMTPLPKLTAGEIPMLLYIGIGITGVGYLAYFKAIEYSDASTGSVVFFMKPVFAPIVAFLLAGENIPLAMMIGIVFMLCGSYIILAKT